MNKPRLCLSWAAIQLAGLALAAATATITIDASKPGPRISPRLYGIFLEEINHGVDGGLYAELIRNRAFEDAKPPEGFVFKQGRWVDGQGPEGLGYDAGYRFDSNGLPYWSLVQDGSARGSLHLDFAQPLNDVTPRSLRLEVEDPGNGRVGVANEGFWGIATRTGETYDLSFYARCANGYAGPLTATLEAPNGDACTTPLEVQGVGPDWQQFKATLRATRTEPKCRFVLTARSKGTVWLDFVSLFPAKTFKGRPNGLRPDIAQMIADLKPGFVRFPGGCVVEGGTVETAYNWKLTIGPVERRAERWGAWNYRRTHGLGFLEYLQFCEDIDAEPLHVGFAGQTCLFRFAENVPLAEMGWVLTNFLDAIEYANGDPTTTWGKLRATQGHPRPFALKLVEIGNENGTAEFPPRYRYIEPVLKARYPNISYIADLSWIGRDQMRDCAFDIEDNHFYNSPQWFMANTGLYDRRDRQLPPVYVGEVAVTSGEGGDLKGNLLAALSEGAFLLGLERNADVVKMVSYAPLLAHVEGRSGWHGMIYFDGDRVFGTVSYYLWKLFGLNRPDYTVKTDVNYRPEMQPDIAGAVGVGTWDTAAEFTDIRVEQNGQVLFASDFSGGTTGWQVEGGSWSAPDGALRQGDKAVSTAFIGDENWTDYTLTLKARKLSGAEGFLVLFGRKGGDQYWWNVGGWGNREHGLEFNRSPVGRRARGSIETGRWYDLKIELRGNRIRCYLEGTLVHDETAPTTERFFALAGTDLRAGELILKVINTSAEPVAAAVNLPGVKPGPREAVVTVLSAARFEDNNSLAQPKHILPVNAIANVVAPAFEHEFPARSLTVMRLTIR